MAAVYRATLSAKLAGQVVQNVLHFGKETPASNDKQLLAQAIIDRVLGQWKFLQCRELVWDTVFIQRPADPNDTPLTVTTNVAGEHAAINNYCLPVTAVFKIKTFVGGRTGRGRICIAGPPVSEIVQSKWSPNYFNLMLQVRNSHIFWFRNPTPASGFLMGVAPRNPEGEEFKEMDDLIRRDYPGTQVRRNFFRGK